MALSSPRWTLFNTVWRATPRLAAAWLRVCPGQVGNAPGIGAAPGPGDGLRERLA